MADHWWWVWSLSRAVVKGLDLKYQRSWSHVLKTLTVFHRVAGEKCHSAMGQVERATPFLFSLLHTPHLQLLPTICSLHSLPDFLFSTQLEEAVGAAIVTMGPE